MATMANQLAAATEYDVSYCTSLIQSGGQLTLDQISDLCNKLRINFDDIYRFAFSEKLVAPIIARHAYSRVKLEFHVSTIAEQDVNASSDIMWLSGYAYKQLISSADTILFDSVDAEVFVLNQVYFLKFDEDFELAECVKTNPFYSSFRLAEGKECIKLRNKRQTLNATDDTLSFSVHRLIATFRVDFSEK